MKNRDAGQVHTSDNNQRTTPSPPSTQVNIAGEISDNARVETLISCNITHHHDNQEKTVSCAELISIIKEKYKQENTLPDMLGGPILTLKEGCYINLALIKSDEQIAKEQSLKQPSNPDSESTAHPTQRDNRLSSFEDIHRPQKPLPLNKLFVTQSDKHSNTTADKPIQRILMLGRAGIGKSTLCQYLAYRWADDTKTKEETWLEKYDVLLWIKLRELLSVYNSLKEQHKRCGVADVVTNCCVLGLDSTNEVLITQAVNDLIQDASKKLLWVLDGFDEVAHLYGNAQHPLYSVLHEVFPKAATPAPLHQVLLTSRPYATQGLQVDRTIENIGLLDDDIPRYVTQYFNKLSNPHPDLGKKVITQIKTNPNIHGMAHVPINAYLLCHLYQKESNPQQEDTSLKSFTLTQLYQQLIVDLCKRMVKQPRHSENLSDEQQEERLEDYPEDIIERYRASLWALAHLAFQGLTDDKAGLTLDWSLQQHVLRSLRMKIVDYKKNLLPLGLLKTIRETSEDTLKAPRYFMHLTFQEFFAALYLVWSLAEYGQATQQDKDRALNFLKNNKYTPRHQVIFWFAAGLVRDAIWFNNDDTIQQTALTNLWEKSFLSEPQDITGLGQFHLLTHAFEEGGEPTSLSTSSQDNPINTAWVFIKDTIDKTLVGRIIDNKNTRLFESLFTTLTVCPHLSNNHAQPLVKYLQHDNWVVRSRAICALAILNSIDSHCIQLFTKHLDDKNPDVRSNTIHILAQPNVTDSHSIQLIAERLDDKDPSVRENAIDALAKLNATDSHSIQLIAQYLQHEKPGVRKSAIDALAKLNVTDSHSIQLITERLDDDNWNVRNSAIKALAKLNATDSHCIQLITEYLQHEEPDVRSSAINALAELNVTDSHCIQLIAERLDDNHWHVRKSAINTLAKLNATDSHRIQLITQCLEDNNWHVRSSAINALAELNVTDSHCIQLIAERLDDNHWSVRKSAINALAKLNATDSHSIQLIAECLNDKDPSIRSRAIKALTKLNATDSHSIQLITESLDDEEPDVRSSAINALAELNVTDSHSIQLIAERLDDKDPSIRKSAINALAKLNATDPHSIQLIAEHLDDNHWSVRYHAINTLAQLNVTDSHSIQLIAKRLDDKKPGIRESAINALAKLNATDSHSIQLIAERLDDNDWRVHKSAIKALIELNATDSHSIQLIAERLDDKDWRVRKSVTDALAQLNATDAHSIQLIAERLDDKDSDVRKSAVKALNRLQPHLTMECWLPLWNKRLADDSKGALSATTVRRLMMAWIDKHLSTQTNCHFASNTSLFKITRLFAKWIFDGLQLPLVIDENQHTLNMITTESTKALSITFPNHPLGQTAFKQCQQALELESLIHPIVPFPGHTHPHIQHLKPEHRFNALQQQLEHYLNTNEDFDFDYVLQNILHTYAALFEQKPELWQRIIDLVLEHPANQLLAKNPILHHFYKTASIQTLLEKHHKNVDIYLSKGEKYYNKAQLDKAIQQYEQAVMVASNDSTPYHNLACFYHTKAHSVSADEALQYCKLAEHSFNQALKLNPTPQLYAEYGQFFYIQRRYEKALPLLNQAITATQEVTETNLLYNLMELPTVDTALQIWIQNYETLNINSAHLAHYLIYRCYEALEQTQQQTAWLNQWSQWLASLPGEYPVSQYLLTTCQNEQAGTAIYSPVCSDTTQSNDEPPTHAQTQPLKNQHPTTKIPLTTTQPKQTTTSTGSAETHIHEHWQHLLGVSLGPRRRSFTIWPTPFAPLPTRIQASTSHDITSDNEENASQNTDTSSSSPNSSYVALYKK